MTTCIVPKSDESEENTDKEINSDYVTLHINAINTPTSMAKQGKIVIIKTVQCFIHT